MFSQLENEIIKTLGGKQKTIVQIADKIYNLDEQPTGNNCVSNAIRSINEKCKYHRLGWFINGQGFGRSGKTVWKDKQTKTLRG